MRIMDRNWKRVIVEIFAFQRTKVAHFLQIEKKAAESFGQ